MHFHVMLDVIRAFRLARTVQIYMQVHGKSARWVCRTRQCRLPSAFFTAATVAIVYVRVAAERTARLRTLEKFF